MQEIPDILSRLQRLTNECGADFKHWRMDEADSFRQFFRRYGKAGTGVNNDVVLFNDALRLKPAVETRPIVRTDDEVKLTVGIGFAQFFERIYTVRRTGKMKFKIRSTEMGVIADTQFYKPETQFVTP